MSGPLKEYQDFIDWLVEIRPSVLVHWVEERGWPQLPENQAFNRLLSELSAEQRVVVGQIVQEGRDGGIHDVLVGLAAYGLSRDGVELAREPYGYDMHYDWINRCEEHAWPENDLKDEYKNP